MQGLADGYFIIPYTIGNYLATTKLDKVADDHPAFRESENEITRTSEDGSSESEENALSIRFIRSSES